MNVKTLELIHRLLKEEVARTTAINTEKKKKFDEAVKNMMFWDEEGRKIADDYDSANLDLETANEALKEFESKQF